jgi:hypothetical protein
MSAAPADLRCELRINVFPLAIISIEGGGKMRKLIGQQFGRSARAGARARSGDRWG